MYISNSKSFDFYRNFDASKFSNKKHLNQICTCTRLIYGTHLVMSPLGLEGGFQATSMAVDVMFSTRGEDIPMGISARVRTLIYTQTFSSLKNL